MVRTSYDGGHPIHSDVRLVDSLDLNDPEVLELYNELIVFKSDPSRQQITMPKTMTAKQRRDAHLIAEKLGLAHFSEGFGADRQLHIAKKSAAASTVRVSPSLGWQGARRLFLRLSLSPV